MRTMLVASVSLLIASPAWATITMSRRQSRHTSTTSTSTSTSTSSTAETKQTIKTKAPEHIDVNGPMQVNGQVNTSTLTFDEVHQGLADESMVKQPSTYRDEITKDSGLFESP
jgi:hypothetical protein